ncbi:response regulator [Paenibacillus sanguinis]|uniref:response regulator n=1 Tax=Paenibacillus sanguinis TaxID=225906 RepID=UPI0003A54EDC|nr:response regulator [Paenibacillus sanguinis]
MMIRVLLVDDEPIVRIAMRELIPWERLGCEIAGEAAHGREALKRLEGNGIDLLLVDMQMPHMNGIELIRELHARGRMEELVVIVLSAYSDYEYVREAFLYGASDYMIKNDLEEAKVVPVINKAVEVIYQRMNAWERRNQETRSREQKLKENWLVNAVRLHANGSPVAVETLSLEEVGEGTKAANTEPFLFLKWWSEAGGRDRQSIGCLLLDPCHRGKQGGDLEQQARFVMHTVRQVVEGYGHELIIVPVDPGEFAMLLWVTERAEGQPYRIRMTEMLHKTFSHLQQYVGVTGAVGLAEPCSHWQAWQSRYLKARLLAQLRFFRGGGEVFFTEALPAQTEQGQKPPVWNISGLIRNIELGSGEWERELQEGMERLRQSGHTMIEVLLQPYLALLWELGSLLRAQGLDWGELSVGNPSPAEQLKQFNFLTEVENYMLGLVRQVAEMVHPLSRVAETAPRLVSKVKEWIDGHYHEPLSLTLASEMAGISESYLSKVFAKEMGETFVEYVARRRIENAIVMLQSGMKLYEIGERVGYPNPGHFTKVFKRITGKTPLEYREQLKEDVQKVVFPERSCSRSKLDIES